MKNEISRKKYKSVGHARNLNSINPFSPKGIMPCSLMGAAFSLIMAVLLGLISAALIYKTADPASFVVPAALSALYISALLGGFFASRLNGGSALLCGLLTGVILAALTFILSLPINESLSSDYKIIESLSLRTAVIVCTIIGAFIGVTKQNSKSKKRKNHKKR